MMQLFVLFHIQFRNTGRKIYNLLGGNEKNLLADLKGAFDFLKTSNKFQNTLIMRTRMNFAIIGQLDI